MKFFTSQIYAVIDFVQINVLSPASKMKLYQYNNNNNIIVHFSEWICTFIALLFLSSKIFCLDNKLKKSETLPIWCLWKNIQPFCSGGFQTLTELSIKWPIVLQRTCCWGCSAAEACSSCLHSGGNWEKGSWERRRWRISPHALMAPVPWITGRYSGKLQQG